MAISLSVDDRFLSVDTFTDGTVRVYDVSDPHHPKLVEERQIGSQLGMVSQTWGGERLYFTVSLLSNWGRRGKDDEQFLEAYRWDGRKLSPLFTVDFLKQALGRPHVERLGQDSFRVSGD